MLPVKLNLRFLLIVFSMSVLLLSPYTLSARSAERPIRVATTICPPFVMHDSGEFTGLSIFLLDKIAEELGLEYSIEEYELSEMLEAISQNKADIAVYCLSITQEREVIIDFSQPFYETHLSIAVKQRGFMHTIKMIFRSEKLYTIIGIIFAGAALIGGILFLLEHKVNDKLYAMKSRSGKLMEAFITGLLFLTSAPIRYYEFRTFSGRVISAFLAVGGTMMIASITALLASAFTLDHMHSEITGPQNLSKVKVGVMEETTSFEYLQEQGINSQVFKDHQELLTALDAGKLDAAVFDSAILKYMIRKAQSEGRYESLLVLPFEFEKQLYAFGIPDASPYREELNRKMLAILESPVWKKELVKYFGK